MKVDIAVPGTFHAFTLGSQLEELQYLRNIYTTYPEFMVNVGEIPNERISHIRYPEVLMRIGHRLPILKDIIPSQWSDPFARWKGILFDKAVARRLQPVEDGLFVGFAGVCLESLKRANKLGMTTVVERSSAHIRIQKEILDEEYERHGLGEYPISENHIEREEQEYRIADYVITPSNFVKESFLEQGYDEEKIRCVPLGVNPPNNHARSPTETTYFIYSGAVTLRKGIQYLLPAWDSLNISDAELIITSEIDESAQQIVQKYKNKDDIHFVGWVDDLYEWFDKSSVFVFPSLEDGFGLVVIEAMASGLPVIVSENTGAKDCVRDGIDGDIIPAKDTEALADAMRRMYDQPNKRKEMGNAAREQIKSNYTVRDYGNRIISEYQRIVNNSC